MFTTWVVDTTAGVDGTAAGYDVCLDQLVQLIETDDPPPFIDADPTALRVRSPGGHRQVRLDEPFVRVGLGGVWNTR